MPRPFLLVLLMALATTCLAAADPVRVVCIGDSITQGNDGRPDRQRTFSWRYPLWKRCLDAGVALEMVGSMTTGFEGAPPYAPHKGKDFPNVHEGRWGWTAMGLRDELRRSGPPWTADVAIILLGTNGNSEGKPFTETVTAVGDLVALLRARNPQVRVAIGQPFQPWKPFPELAAAYATLASDLSTATSPVITVATSEGWVSDPKQPGSCTTDWVHPNTTGDEHLAQRFFAAIAPWLKPARR
jgi:lysophospholipase L1-like esterase